MATRAVSKAVYETDCDWCGEETARKAGVPPRGWARFKVKRNVNGKMTRVVEDVGPACLAEFDAMREAQLPPEAA